MAECLISSEQGLCTHGTEQSSIRVPFEVGAMLDRTVPKVTTNSSADFNTKLSSFRSVQLFYCALTFTFFPAAVTASPTK